MKELTLIVEHSDGLFWAQISEYPSVFTSGETLDDLKNNATEALTLYAEESGQSVNSPFSWNVVFDLNDFFSKIDYINNERLAERSGLPLEILNQYASRATFASQAHVEQLEAALEQIVRELERSRSVVRLAS